MLKDKTIKKHTGVLPCVKYQRQHQVSFVCGVTLKKIKHACAIYRMTSSHPETLVSS